MKPVHSFSVPARILIGLWAGIVFFEGSAYAQERDIDTLHIFKADTVRLGFDDVLPLSALYDSADKEDWHYIYRWSTGERTDGIQAKFDGRRKVLYTGQRLSARHWPGEYDTLGLNAYVSRDDIRTYYADINDDTVVLRAPDMKGATVRYEWSDYFSFFEDRLLPDTEQCLVLYWDMWWERYASSEFSCRVTAVSAEGDTTVLQSFIKLHFPYIRNDSLVQTPLGKKFHDYNIWAMTEYTQIYARLSDTLHFFSEIDFDLYPDFAHVADFEFDRNLWIIYPCRTDKERIYDSVINIYFKDNLYNVIACTNGYNTPTGSSATVGTRHYVYWGIKPDAEIETDSVWVFFPQYPYSNLGGRVDVCLPPGAPLPADSDTVYTFNLGPWNRELEYVEYAWLDGTKGASGGDSIVGRDSAFAYLFGRMDSVAPDLYTGRVVTLVESDSLWQDSCECYIPCTEAACSKYDTVQIYLHLLPSLKENVFLPYDTTLCAHLDLELNLSDTAVVYRCFWLDRDSVALPYGYDTARYTVQGMRGLDGYGVGTDTREPRFFQLRLDHKICGVSFFDTLLVYDQVKPHFELLCHDTLICLDEPVKIDSLSPHVYRPFYVFEWNDGTKGSGYTFSDSGVYVLQFFVGKDFAVCGYDTVPDTIRVRWSDPAQTLITLGDTSFCEKLSVTLDASVPFPTTLYCWQDGPILDPEEDFGDETDSIIFSSVSVKVFKEEGTYNISLFDTMGCINRKEINITLEDCSPKLDIPNVFTPNGDGVNDVWKFKQLEWCVDVKVEVVDRWGQPVLKTKVATADDFEWNGTVNNKGRRLPDGPYFYMVTYKDVYGKSKVQSGSITILGTSE